MQFGHTKIFAWEQSPFTPAKLLLNQNKRRIYSHYSCYINFQSGLLLVHPKQHIFSFQKTLDHIITQTSHVGQQAPTHKFRQTKVRSPITHSTLLRRSKASYKLATTFVFASGRVRRGLVLSKHAFTPMEEKWADCSLQIYWQVYPLLNGNIWWEQQTAGYKWQLGQSSAAPQQRLPSAEERAASLLQHPQVPACDSLPWVKGLLFPEAAIPGEKMDLRGTTDNEAATTSSHPASTTASRSVALSWFWQG